MMNKYPFWVIKSDAKRLLRGKWNPLVLSLFVPFLLFMALQVTCFSKIESMPPTPKREQYLFYAQITILVFSVVMQLLMAGIYENLKPTRKKASFFSVYYVSVKKIWKMLPTLLVVHVIPFRITYWLSYGEAIRFYDYLMFSVMDYHVYLLILQIIIGIVGLVSMYFQYSLLLVPAITVEHPEYGGLRLMKESFRASKGNRIYLALLSISFMGWILLGSLAYIGILWAILYLYAANYAYYRRLTITEEPITVSEITE